MDCEVIGLVVEENEGHSTGKVTLRGPTGTIVLVCDAEMAKSLRIGKTVELRMIRSRAPREVLSEDLVAPATTNGSRSIRA